MNRTDLELFKQMLKDDSIHLTVAQVARVNLAQDKSIAFLECIDVINGQELVCMMTWDSIGNGTASGDLPDPKDLYLVGYSNSNYNQAFAIKRMSSKAEKIPKQITDGHHAVMAKTGKQLHLTSDTKINLGLGNPNSAPTEPVVLGNVLKSLMNDFINAILNATPGIGVSSMGPVMLNPALRTQLTQIQTQYLSTTSTNILSQLVFTERGGA